MKSGPQYSNTRVLDCPAGIHLLVVRENVGPLSLPHQMLPIKRISWRFSGPVHVISTRVTCNDRSPLFVMSTDTSSSWISSPLTSHSQSSGGKVLVGGGGEVLVGGGGKVLEGGGEVLVGGGVLLGGTDDGVAVAAVVGEGDGGAKEAV